MSESIHERLDREVARLKIDQTDRVTRVSDSFLAGIEHASMIAYRMETVVVAEGRISVADLLEPDADKQPDRTIGLSANDLGRLLVKAAAEGLRVGRAGTDGDFTAEGISCHVLLDSGLIDIAGGN